MVKKILETVVNPVPGDQVDTGTKFLDMIKENPVTTTLVVVTTVLVIGFIVLSVVVSRKRNKK